MNQRKKNIGVFSGNDVPLNSHLPSLLPFPEHDVIHHKEDASVKDFLDVMQFAPFAITTKRKVTAKKEITLPKCKLEVTANNEYGMATINDWDIVRYLIGQLVKRVNAQINNDWPVKTPNVLEVSSYQILTFLKRSDSVTNYLTLLEALDRLSTTSFKITGKLNASSRMIQAGVRLIDGYKILEFTDGKEDDSLTDQNNGRRPASKIAIDIPDWMIELVEVNHKSLKTYSKEGAEVLFSLNRAPIKKFLYVIANKVAGKSNWEMTLDDLYKRSGEVEYPEKKEFVKAIKKAVEDGEIGEYKFMLVKQKLLIQHKNYKPKSIKDLTPDTVQEELPL